MRAPETQSQGCPNSTAVYYKNGVDRYTSVEPQMVGGYPWRSSSRDGSHHTIPNAAGYREPTPYFGHRLTYQWGRCDYQLAGLITGGRNSFLFGASPKSWETEAKAGLAECRSKALAKFTDVSVDLSVAFAERKKTANMLFEAANGLYHLIGNIRKGKWNQLPWAVRKRILNAGNSVPQAWLWYRYGVMPTLLDVYGAMEALERRDNGQYDRYIVTTRKKLRSELKYAEPVQNTYFGRYYTMPVQQSESVHVSYGCKVRLDAALTQAEYLRLAEAGVTNPLTTAWELIPFSFVVDWFTNAGEFLGNVTALKPYTFLGAAETWFFTEERVRTYTPTGGGKLTINLVEPVTRYSKFVRSAGTKPPSQSLYLKNDPLNLKRLYDSIALLKGVSNKDLYIKPPKGKR